MEDPQIDHQPIRHPIDFDNNLAYNLAVVSNLLNTGVTRNITEHYGVGITAWRVLGIMGAYAPMYAKDIVQRTGIDKATVSRAVNQMIADGLVERRPEPRDKRHTRLQLTAQGIALHDRITPLAKRFYGHFEAVLAPEERRSLLELLKKVRARADITLDQLLEEIA